MRATRPLLTLTLIAAALAAGCTSTPPVESTAAPAPVKSAQPTAPTPAAQQPVETPKVATVAPITTTSNGLPAELTDPKSPLSKRNVFFDFDKYDIKPEFKDLVTAHGKYLASNGQMKVLIQGNADERGSREYNLALGQKRADAVKKALLLTGAKEEQVESVSLGEEKPRCADHTEACWTQNRRGDILYKGEF